MVRDHAVTLTGLDTNATYYFRVKSSDAAGNTSASPVSTFVTLTSTVAGDANGDGIVNAADITAVERMIAGLEPATTSADANLDGKVNSADITKVERIIAGLT
jgi:hypothetical protein